MWYGGPGQHEHLRDVEAGLLRGDSGDREEDEHEEVRGVILVMIIRGDSGKRGDQQEDVKIIIRKRGIQLHIFKSLDLQLNG